MGEGTPGRIRVVTLNLWGEQEPLAQRMELCLAQLRALGPDVVALQEVRQIEGQLRNQAATLAEGLSLRCLFQEATEWGGGLEGVAILSRLPIEDHGHAELPHATQAERRVVLWARLRAGNTRVAVLTSHLNYRLHHGALREDQIYAIDETAAALGAEVTVLLGDFNAVPESDEIRFLRGLHSLRGRRTYYQDAYGKLHPGEPGYTWSSRNPYTRRLSFLESDRRLDYVFVSPLRRDGRGTIHECRIVLDMPSTTGVYPSDHFGVFAEIQVAPLDG